MSITDKLVYLIRQGAITIERVGVQYRTAVETAMTPRTEEEAAE